MPTEPLQDVIEGRAYARLEPIGCPLCGRALPARRFPARFGMQVSVAECPACRLAFQTPRPSQAASLAYMNWRWSSSGRYVADGPDKRRSARRKLDGVRALLPNARRLLDFGAGSGVFVRVCRDEGIDAVGVEQSEEAIARARDTLGVTLIDGLPDERFDVITLWDVIEHLRDPVAVLAMLKPLLADGGALFMTTGNYENWRRIADGDRWGLYLFDHHFYFTPASLAAVARQAGWTRFRLVGGKHSVPPPGRCLKRPAWGLRAWRAWRAARRTWPEHGDINIMLAVIEP